MKNKTIQSLLKITFCSVAIIALFAAPPLALNASPKDEATAKSEESTEQSSGKPFNSNVAALSALSDADIAQQAQAAAKITPDAPSGTNVSVTATAGTMGPTLYATLGAAFAAINAGTHQGDITCDIVGNTVESASAVLNASGSGSALYNSVLVRPNGGARIITGSIAGAVIKLNGADNVTIDGRIGGTGRNLTVSNSSTAAATAAIWLASVVAGNGCTNDVIRNLEIACGADQQASTNSTFGIIMCGTTISIAANGDDNDNNSFIANRIIRCRDGIVTRGVATNNNIAPVIMDNIIGPAAFGPDQIGKTGIFLQADTGAIVSGNTIQNVGVLAGNAAGGTDRFGIAIGSENWDTGNSTTITSGDYTVTKNVIHDIVEEKTFSVVGIRLGTTRGGPTNNLVANNFIYNIRANGTSGDQVCGIGYANGHTDKIVFNSISMTGDLDPGAALSASTYGNAIRVTQANSANNANLTLRDNSIYLDVNSNTAGVHYYAITLNSSSYAFGTGGLNQNNYYINPGNAQLKTGGLATGGGATTTTEFATLANWQAALTIPQDGASIQADPFYISNTSDLHITGASPNIDVGVNIPPVANDIDMQARPNGPNPDIGADEFYASPGMLQFSSPTYSATEASMTATITVTRTGGSSGMVSVEVGVFDGSALTGTSCAPGIDLIAESPRPLVIFGPFDVAPKNVNITICNDGVPEPNENANLQLLNPTGGATLGNPNQAVLHIINSVAFHGEIDIPGQFQGQPPFYNSLTNPGGLFEAINNGSLSGNLIVNIVSDLTNETGTFPLNQWIETMPSEQTGLNSMTIRPRGMLNAPDGSLPPFTISGNSVGGGLIKLNGADRVTIDGSAVDGGTDRSLTIMNANANASVIWLASAGPGDGANNDTVKNCNISGSPGVVAVAGIVSGSGATPGNDAEAVNNNITVQNNNIFRVQNSCFLRGTAAGSDTGLLVTGNTFGSTVAGDRNTFRGMFVGNTTGSMISGNTINGVASTAGSTSKVVGIQTALVTNNGTIEKNRIGDIKHTNPGTYGATGIDLGGGNNILVRNNFISDINHDMSGGIAFSTQFGVFGIQIEAGTGEMIYGNSVNLFGQFGTNNSALLDAAFAINATTSTGCDVRDNIFACNITGGTTSIAHVAVYLPSGGTPAMNLTENNNSYYNGTDPARQGVGQAGTTPGSNFFVTLSQLKAYSMTLSPAGTNDNASIASTGAVPFVSANDLHLICGAAETDFGVPLAALNNDIDMQPRDAFTPDLGADEQVAPAAVSIVSRKFHGGTPFDVSLPGIEPRSGGPMGNYEMVFTFASTVSAGNAIVSSGIGSVMSTTGNGTNTITVELQGVNDVQCLAVTLICTSDGTNTGDVVGQMTVLVGDSAGTGNNAVNASDVTLTKSRIGQSINAANFRSDVNVSNSISASDVTLTKAKLGNGGVVCKALGKCYGRDDCIGIGAITDCAVCLDPPNPSGASWRSGAGVCYPDTCPP